MPRSRSHENRRKGAAARVRERSVAFKGWKTSDREEIERRRLRASLESLEIEVLEPRQPFYGTFRTRSRSGAGFYTVEIRSLDQLLNSCECPDFRVNGLGTCKHIEAVLARLRRGRVRLFSRAAREGCPRTEIFLSWMNGGGTPQVRVAWSARSSDGARETLTPFFSAGNALLSDPMHGLPALRRVLEAAPEEVRAEIRIAREVENWVDELGRRQRQAHSREDFLRDLATGKRDLDFLKLPLYPYQREGMLHLAFGERTLLADDMGLGKTVQAVAACELLRRLRGVERVLVVAPVSLKAEWEEQIAKFTGLPSLLIWGPRGQRLKLYRQSSFFYLANYEQIRADADDINRILAPDAVILDEAQRIKNWQTKTAKAVKRLSSPYAFVLTGTPLENRIDEIYSIVDFLDPRVLGPLFRFNREFYELDEKGRPRGYKNLDELRRRIRPLMLRRRKEEVEDQLPARTVNNFFVEMEAEQRVRYEEYSMRVARLLAVTKRRPLTREEAEKLQKWLACMRMICDTPYILDDECRVSPKLDELESILEEVLESPESKVLIFSEWERMLHLVRELASEMGLSFAWHTGSVPQPARREQIRRFKTEGDCRLFLSTDCGSTGLNLQAANVVVNLDLPWNPAKLEQRIARAWRKHQTRGVTVINLICQDSIEHRMLGLLAQKQQLADRLLDGRGDLTSMSLPSGRSAFIDRLEELMGLDLRGISAPRPKKGRARPAPVDNPFAVFRDDLLARLPERVLLVESHANGGNRGKLLVVVDRDAEPLRPLAGRLLRDSFPGEAGEPALELLDRATYETIQRLIREGFLQPNGTPGRTIHRHPLFDKSRSEIVQRRKAEAQELLSLAERKMRMAELLAEGGFAVEALPPASEAVEGALRALSVFHGEEIASESGTEAVLHALEARLIARRALPETATAARAQIREAIRRSSPTEEIPGHLLPAGRRILEHVLTVLNQATLG